MSNNQVGSKNKVAFVIGEAVDGAADIRRVDIWIANHLMTCYDNIEFVSSLISSACFDIEKENKRQEYDSVFHRLDISDIHRSLVESRIEASSSFDGDYFLDHQVLDWGPVTDNFVAFIIKIDNGYYITCQFTSGPCDGVSETEIFSAAIDYDVWIDELRKFVTVLQQWVK